MMLKTKPFYLFGVPIYDLTVQQNFGSWGISYQTTFQFSLNDHQYVSQIKSQIANYNLQTVGLGHGVQCPYCFHYNPVGTSICMRCGGLTEVIEYVKPESLPLTLLETYIDCSLGISENVQHGFKFSMDSDDFNKLHHAIHSGLYYTDSLALGLYMCQFCGSVVRDGDDCHNCGGVRLPFSELVKIDHMCLYCGSKIRGNLFCNSCGASISGSTIKC